MTELAYGEQNPSAGETAVSWQTWSDGSGGTPDVSGDSAWGQLKLNLTGEEARSAVVDHGSVATRTYTLTENRYGTGSGDATLQIRTSTSSFLADDVSPSWTTYTAPLSVSCRYVQIRETTYTYTPFYVDNAATGANNGTSWGDAWESFADINWATLANASQACLYISGGSTSKTYSETLQPGAGGTAGDFLTIDVGANSPSPTGHGGTVIVDGGGTRENGILLTEDASYIRINGLSGTTYKFEIRNCAPRTTVGASGYNCIRQYNGNYVYIDYIKLPDITSFGISFDNCDYGRVRGCDITSLDSTNDYWIAGIYLQYCANFTVENNTAVMSNSPVYEGAGDPYGDCVQLYDVTDMVFRNNYLKWLTGKGNAQCGGLMVDFVRGTSYFYNNVVIGNSLNPTEIWQHEETDTGSLYILNNTIVSTHATQGRGIHFNNNGAAANVAAIKNNIMVSPNGYLIYDELGIDDARIDYNCLVTGGSYVANNGTDRTWAGWQALGFDANGINSAPLYDATDEYRLNDLDTPCLVAGDDQDAYFTTDRDGEARPSGLWSIGAYQYHIAETKTSVPHYAGATYPTGNGVLAIRFDDGREEDYTVAYPLLAERGLKAGWALPVTYLDLYLTTAHALEMQADGQEMMCHTWNHSPAPTEYKGFYKETAAAALELRSRGLYIDGWVLSGSWSGTYWNSMTPPTMDFKTNPAYANERQFLADYFHFWMAYLYDWNELSLPVASQYYAGATYRSPDTWSLNDMKAVADWCVTNQKATVMLFHPAMFDTQDYVTTANFEAFLDYVQTLVANGDLTVLTPSQLMFATEA